jgi:ABC-2 type transport system ATP-binding protein
MTQPLLQTQGLTKKYGEFTALNQVSLTLGQGDIYGLVGRNGAGKTTFFKCVLGLANPSAGTVVINGGQRLGRKQIGFMMSPAFFPYLNPAQSLQYLRRVKGLRDKDEVPRLLQRVGLEGVTKPFKAFSTGMKQRLGLAGAMLGSPPLVVLDEPVNGLDPQGIADMRGIILRENQEQGTTFIISSHILSELDLVATRFGFIEQGTLLREITHAHLHAHTKKSLVVEVDDGDKALEVLEALGAAVSREGSRLVLTSHLERPQEVARALVTAGVGLYRLSPQATTLEEYFMRLIEGVAHAELPAR